MSRPFTHQALSAFRCIRLSPSPKTLSFHEQNILRITSQRKRIRSRKCYSSYSRDEPLSGRRSSPRIVATCIISTLLASLILQLLKRPESNDAPPNHPLSSPNARGARVEATQVRAGAEEVEQVSTGTSTVPFFPRKIQLPRSNVEDGKSRTLPAGIGAIKQEEEYQLIGLGIRTVSFLRIQVYVVGLYVACSDLSELQASMVREVAAPGATTLIESEKDDLKLRLMEGADSERIWAEVLKSGSIKSALRIVPTRGTDFGHLRDGWVRGITSRSKGADFEDDDFKTAVGDFKKVFGGRKLEKGKALLLARDGNGELRAWINEGKPGSQGHQPEQGSSSLLVPLGGVQDERVSRLVWLTYLGGDSVASEGARKNIVEGILDLAERPIGTVETQVL